MLTGNYIPAFVTVAGSGSRLDWLGKCPRGQRQHDLIDPARAALPLAIAGSNEPS
jgi:hypothetical protein